MDPRYEPYDLADEAYETFEQQTLRLRLLQSAEPGVRVSRDHVEALTHWVARYQRQRALMALLLKGLVRVTMNDGEPMLQAETEHPLAPLDELEARGALPPSWMNDRMPLPRR